jgi:hypothetical protein
MIDTTLPRPKVDGIGRVLYRCAECGEQMEPEQAVIADGKSYHPEHLPENPDGR